MTTSPLHTDADIDEYIKDTEKVDEEQEEEERKIEHHPESMSFNKTVSYGAQSIRMNIDKRMTLNRTVDGEGDDSKNGQTVIEEGEENSTEEQNEEELEETDYDQQKSLKELYKDEMPLKQKVVLGPIAKYKYYGKRERK